MSSSYTVKIDCEIIELLVTVSICYLRSCSDSNSDPTSHHTLITQVIGHFAVNPTCHLPLFVIYKAAVYYKAALQHIRIEITYFMYIKNNTSSLYLTIALSIQKKSSMKGVPF
jgi:hypothetical protein